MSGWLRINALVFCFSSLFEGSVLSDERVAEEFNFLDEDVDLSV